MHAGRLQGDVQFQKSYRHRTEGRFRLQTVHPRAVRVWETHMVDMSVARNKVPVVPSSWTIKDTGYRLESGLRANRRSELEF